jgi:hypothetical protein
MAAVVELVLGVTCLVCCLWTFRKWQLRQRLCQCLSPRVSSNQVQHSHMLKPRLEWMIGVCYNPPSFKQSLSFFVSVFVFVSICYCMLTLFLFPLNIVFVGLYSSVACTLPGCACWYLSCSITGISSEFGRIVVADFFTVNLVFVLCDSRLEDALTADLRNMNRLAKVCTLFATFQHLVIRWVLTKAASLQLCLASNVAWVVEGLRFKV